MSTLSLFSNANVLPNLIGGILFDLDLNKLVTFQREPSVLLTWVNLFCQRVFLTFAKHIEIILTNESLISLYIFEFLFF